MGLGGLGDEVAFESKVAMAKAMVRRAVADRIPLRWVIADAAHGFSKGWRSEYDWARVDVRPWHRPDRRHWVIARRSVARPQEIYYYIAYCPAGTTLDDLIRIAGSRWAIEECFQSARQECAAWPTARSAATPDGTANMTLAMAARACPTVLRARQLDTGKAETAPPGSSTSASPRYDG